VGGTETARLKSLLGLTDKTDIILFIHINKEESYCFKMRSHFSRSVGALFLYTKVATVFYTEMAEKHYM